MRNSTRRYVAYYRVSTAKQGRSGLGLRLVEPRKGIGCRVGPGRQKKAPEGGPGLENTMRVVLV